MNIVKIYPFSQPSVVHDIALVYQETFGGYPWNEGYLCPVCNEKFGLQFTANICPSCLDTGKKVNVVQFWSIDKIITTFYQRMIKPDSLCLAMYQETEAIGFAWGHRVIVNESLDTYWTTLGLEYEAYFYLNQFGIQPGNQGKGFGKKLIEQIFLEQNEKNILLRTLYGSPMFDMILKIGGVKVASFPNSNQVVMTLNR